MNRKKRDFQRSASRTPCCAISLRRHHEEEQLRAFCLAFAEAIHFPADAFVLGEPISVSAIEYAGNPRCGLLATCRTQKGAEYRVAAFNVVFPRERQRHAAAPTALAGAWNRGGR